MAKSNDTKVKEALRRWPNRTEAWDPGNGSWLRAQPIAASSSVTHPRLRHAGSSESKTQPDGLWFRLGREESSDVDCHWYVDVIAFEACSSGQNMLEKKGKYKPSLKSVLLEVDRPWASSRIRAEGRNGPWKERTALVPELASVFEYHHELNRVLIPIRHLALVIAVEEAHYRRLFKFWVPEPHEFMCKTNSLRSWSSQKWKEFVLGMVYRKNFYTTR